MKLWEAILIGCDRREKTNGLMFRTYTDGRVCSCALGAAYEGTFGEIEYDDFKIELKLKDAYPVLTKTVSDRMTLDGLIINLNDVEGWSREKIALELVKPFEESELRQEGEYGEL